MSNEGNSSMAESVVTLSSKDHPRELATEFKSFLDTNSFVDCTVSAEGQSLNAHRLVLSACSPYFHKLFCEETEDHPVVILIDESFQNLKAVIDFMYLGVTQVPERDYSAFVTLAKSLQVKGLSRISKNVPGSATKNITQDPPAKNQVTDEVQGIDASQKDSSENHSQKIAHHLDGNTDPVDTHTLISSKANGALHKRRPKAVQTSLQEQGSPQDPSAKNQKIVHHLDDNTDPADTHSLVSVKGNSALCKPRPKSVKTPSQEQGRPQGALYLKVQPYLYAVISGAKNKLLVKSNETLSSQMGGGTSSGNGQVFLISGAGSLPPVGLQATQQRSEERLPSGGSQQSTTPLPHEEPVQDAVAPSPPSSPAGRKRKQKKKYICKVCGRAFVSPGQLNVHNRTHTGERPFLCNVCGATFVTKNQLAIHSTLHTGERPYECKFCGKTFRQKSNLNVHLPMHTGKRPHRCDVCGKTYLQKHALTQHKNLHTGELPHRCDICGVAFRRSDNLRIHKIRHTGEWPFRCDECGKTFVKKSRLTQHMPVHTGERPYKCDVCGKSFGFQTSLATHMQIHTGERPYCCEVCGKSFRQKHSFVDHSRRHTGERPYCCELCGASYHQQSGLAYHLRTHNKTQPP